jgi:hypothetical protein
VRRWENALLAVALVVVGMLIAVGAAIVVEWVCRICGR